MNLNNPFENDRYHADQIAMILGSHFKSFGLPVTLKNSDLLDFTLQSLAAAGIKKPLFIAKERFIVLSVLSYPQFYVSASPSIELVASVEGTPLCWYGTGRFKQRDMMNDLRSLGVGLVEDSFMEINVQPCFAQIKDLLEWPAYKPE